MKKLLAIVLVFASWSAQAQKWGMEYGLNYAYANPAGGMGQVIKQGHGISLHFGFVQPNQRLAFGVDVNFTQYGQQTTYESYTFDNGIDAPMEIIVSNHYGNFLGYSRLNLTTKGFIRPFIIGKVGYAGFKTDLNIYDPNEEDSCEPVEDDVLYKDGTMIGVIGAGAKVDFSSVFKRLPQGMLYLETSVNYTHGGQVRYMNVNAESHAQHHGSTDADPVMAQFVNTQTQVVHEHHVGNLYNNQVQVVEVQFGVSMYFSRMGRN